MATKKKTDKKVEPIEEKEEDLVEETEEEEVEEETRAPIPKPKPKSKKKTTKKKESSKAQQAVENLVKETIKVETRKERDMNEMVSVISIVNSPLLYKSKAQAGYSVEWGEFLEENWMEYKELITMRNTQRAFFEKPWIIMEWDVLEDLKVAQYYENMIDLSKLDGIFESTPEEMIELLNRVPVGIRDLIVDRAYELRVNGVLDSLNLIKAIEETCDVELDIALN